MPQHAAACDLRVRYVGCIGILLCIALTGCSAQSVEDVKARRLERAKELVEKQQFREALTEYRHVATLDPQDDDAQYELALLHLKMGTADDAVLAHQALLKVLRLNPSRSDAHLEIARLYLIDEQPAKARLHADAVLATEPMHPDGHLIRGQSLIREGSVLEGMAEVQKSIQADPELIGGYLELARTHAKQHNYAAAETVLRDALQMNPKSVEMIMALGDVLVAAGQVSAAEAEYRRGLDVDSKNGALYFRLAILKQRQKRPGEAEAIYHHWIHVVPNDVGAYVALAQLYGTIGRLKEALESYQRARQVDSSSMVAREALIAFYLETNRLNEAGLEIGGLLKQYPRSIGGRVLEARLHLLQGEAQEAMSVLQELGREAPRSATVQQYLGVALARVNRLPEALAALKEARTLDPESSDIRTNLAQVYLLQGSVYPAITEGEAAIQFNARNVPALRVLGEAHLLAGDTKRALAIFQELITAFPDDPSIHQRLGVIARIQQRATEAVAHFEQALEKNPQFTDALEQIVATFLSQGKVGQARERVGRQIHTVPNDPKLHNLLGQLLIMSKEFSEAEAAFKKALSLDGTLLPAYANLGELYARQGQTDRAIGEFEAIIAKSPQHVPTLMILGMLHEQRGDFPRATARYEEAVRVNPKFAPAANNLAWILIEHGGDTDRALSYAEMARGTLPRDARIADTLGWIYYHKQMYAKSVSLLTEAVDGFPEEPLVLYHYGLAQYGNNNSEEAKKSLSKFLTLSPADPHARKAKEILAAIS